jgi:hypothetical protein
MNFHIMDGQHRCRAMQELHKKHPNQALWFHFRVHVVANEKEAHDSLVHFQDQYPADPRAFLRSQRHTRFATEVVTQLNERYPRAFRNSEVKLSARQGGGQTPDPRRPFLNDYLVFWLLDTSGLLDTPGATPTSILERLCEMNHLLAAKAPTELGPSVTQAMVQQAHGTCADCFLGFFRDGKLHWERYARELRPVPELPSSSGGRQRAREEPVYMCCPITCELFEEPVIAQCCGQSFSRKAIETHLRTTPRCPLCNSTSLNVSKLTRNVGLASAVEEHRAGKRQRI